MGINELAHLKFSTDEIDVDLDNLPSQGGLIIPPPQPGVYRFRIPHGIAKGLDTFQTDSGQRVEMKFRDDLALLNVSLNQPYPTRITNQERAIGKDGAKASDMAFLLDALDIKPKTSTNKGYAEAMLQAQGMEFVAFSDLTARCNPKTDVYKSDEGKIEGLKGCGAAYATRSYTKKDGTLVTQIPKTSEGTFATEFECSCGALLRCFGGLSKFRAAE